MVCYLEQVQAESDRVKTVREAESRTSRSEWTDRLTPLEDRLKRLLADMPEEVTVQGLSLDAIRRLLAGKWRGNCHPGELGAAFRKLGYVRHRDWSDIEGGFRSKWIQAP